jgi:hypothetical protein
MADIFGSRFAIYHVFVFFHDVEYSAAQLS